MAQSLDNLLYKLSSGTNLFISFIKIACIALSNVSWSETLFYIYRLQRIRRNKRSEMAMPLASHRQRIKQIKFKLNVPCHHFHWDDNVMYTLYSDNKRWNILKTDRCKRLKSITWWLVNDNERWDESTSSQQLIVFKRQKKNEPFHMWLVPEYFVYRVIHNR